MNMFRVLNKRLSPKNPTSQKTILEKNSILKPSREAKAEGIYL
jgi:hypothetical protein